MVTLAGYAIYMHGEQNARLLQLRVEEHDLRERHGKAERRVESYDEAVNCRF